MRTLEIMIAVIFIIAGIVLLNFGMSIYAKTSMHEIYRVLNYIASILCFGFGCLMIKVTVKESNNETI